MAAVGDARKRLAERNELAATIAHRLACTRCRMDWYCGGLSDDDYEAGRLILDLLP